MNSAVAIFVVAFLAGVFAGGIYIGSTITDQVDASWVARGCK